MSEPIYSVTKVYGRDLVICILPAWPTPITGSARVPPNGDMTEAQRRAFVRAERAYLERSRD